jgi:hypothetical protein
VIIGLTKKEDSTKWIEVSDRGIGMTVDTVLNYYLKAGASFRNSDAWRQQHEDEHGHSRILRSGRFGIGVLAGFLLGNEIRVSTRHITSERAEGISFSCRLTDDIIELHHIYRPVGTTISIQVSDAIYSNLLNLSESKSASKTNATMDGATSWDWYCLDEPSVHRILLPEGKYLQQRYSIPSASSRLPPEWRRLPNSDFDEIHWSNQDNAPNLVCNGIVINRDNATNQLSDSKWLSFRKPKISIFDSSGKLPINLQRTELTSTPLRFEDDLLKEVCRDFLAYLIVNAPTKPPLHNNMIEAYSGFKYPGRVSDKWYCCLREGIALLSSWHLQRLSVSKLIFALIEETPGLNMMLVKNSNYCIVPIFASRYPSTIASLLEDRVDNSRIYRGMGRRPSLLENITIVGNRLLGNRVEIEQLREKKNKRDEPRFRDLHREDSEEEDEPGYTDKYHWGYSHNAYGIPDNLLGDFEDESLTKNWALLCDWPKLPDDPDLISPFRLPDKKLANILVSYIRVDSNKHPKSLITDTWRKIIKLPYIPYDTKRRRRELANAYKELAPYIESWGEIKERLDK